MPTASTPFVLRQTAAVLAAGRFDDLGALPEWDLSHLYPAMDSPAFADE